MAVIVVGGHSRNIGKTSVVAGLIARLPEFHWTAFKITQYGHGFCTADGKPCQCETADSCVAVNFEHDLASGTDTSRFLAAGAARSIWVRTRIGMLAEAMPRIEKELAGSENAILESNSVLEFLRPDLYLTVLDPAVADFKDSARRFPSSGRCGPRTFLWHRPPWSRRGSAVFDCGTGVYERGPGRVRAHAGYERCDGAPPTPSPFATCD